MAIVSTDIKLFLSGGGSNTDPDASLGGSISSTEMTSGSLHNLFDKVSGEEAASGDTEYRCIYVKNSHATLTLQGAKIFISTNTPSNDTVVAIGLGSSTAIANESTAPSGVTFSAPTDAANGLSMGDINAGDSVAVWVRRTVSPDAAAATDSFVLTIQGETGA